MKLTRASSYALHAIAHMAQQKSDSPVASHLIAAERGIPERFLLKVLKPLVSNRILVSTKGPNGGYKLAKPPSQISVLDIVEAVDGAISGYAPERQPDPDKFTPAQEKKFQQVWNTLHPKLVHVCNQSADSTRKQLEKVRVSDLLAKKA